jgi:hypothetical protein
LADDRRSAVQLTRDLSVRALVDDSRSNRLVLLWRKLPQESIERVDRFPGIQQLLYSFELLVPELEALHREPLARPVFGSILTSAECELLPGDPVKPRHSRLGSALESTAPSECGGKDFGGQISGNLRAAGPLQEEDEDCILVASIKRAKRLGVASRSSFD